MSTTTLQPRLTQTVKTVAKTEPAQSKERKYLPGLNGVRALASLIIIGAHVDEFSYLFGRHEVGFNDGRFCVHAVTIFFVLSGYLITYLLLQEKEKYKKIHFGKFYTRRILRLWPVYFLILAITFALVHIGGILPETTRDLPNLIYYILFIPNIPFALGGMFSMITPLWSIGVDEQFYAFWPFLINKSSNIARTLLIFIGVYFLVKVGCQFYKPLEKVSLILAVCRLDCMAIGGLGAYLILEKHHLLKIIYNRWLQAACWLICIYSTFFHALHVFTLIDYELYAIVFLILIVNVSTNPKPLISLENKVLNVLGRISYGTQVYHLMVVYLLAYFVGSKLGGLGAIPHFLVMYAATLAISIPLAYLSYEYFEKPFINIKKRFFSASGADSKAPKSEPKTARQNAVPTMA